VRLYLCGVRGSTPAPGADFLRYGGHTSCVAIAHDDDARPTLVLDAGTGLRQVTPLLGGQPFDGTILLTHLHWDHVHGLPFFTGGDREGSRVSLLLPEQEDGATAEQALAKGMSPPHFPIGPSELRGAWTFGTVAPGQLKAEGFTIEARAIPHKGGATLGYRVSDGSSVIAYLPDHCPTALGPGPEGWGEYHAAALELASDADVLLHDAFLLADEVAAEAFFGHAAIDYAIGLGRRAGARRVVLTHHKPGRTDAALDEVASRVAGVRGEVASRVAAPAGAPPPRPPENHAPYLGVDLPEVIVAAEGEIFEL
jgi:phosphoribosyl 1,2-cyclic phosphodiesterase